MTVVETLYPQEILVTPAGETVVDFGQNHAGFMEFTADFPAGTEVTFECAEILQDGNFYHGNYREAESKFTYISDGRRERVRPHFTYFGYRYLRVTGWPRELEKEDLCSKVLCSDLDRIGYLTTGNEKINRLYQNCLWGLRSNFIDMPTDCPQRNERLGWTGDAQIFAPTASWHMDTQAFYRKFLRDLRSEQMRAGGGVPNYIPSKGDFGGATSVWGDAATLIPETLYQFYGDLSDMETYYPLMRDWVEYMRRVDVQTGDERLFRPGFQFGDWLALDGVTEESFKGSTDDDYIGSVYYFRSAQIAAGMAHRLGKTEDEAEYAKLADEIREAVLDEYFTPSGRLSVDTQAAYLVAMQFGLYRDLNKLKEQFLARLKKDCYQIRCGFVGAPLLCVTLAQNGMANLAYDFLFYEGFPGWLYAVNLGATTIWERWNSVLPDGTMHPAGMNSLNHYSYGSVAEFFYEYMAGIRPLAPGFGKVKIAPVPDIRLGHVRCSYDSVSGRYGSEWEIREDGTLWMKVEVPFGCEAEVVLPDCGGENRTMNAGDRIARNGNMILPAGMYEFSYTPTRDYRFPYGPDTRIAQLAGDERAMEILREELPVAYGMIVGGDRENTACTFAELANMAFLGLDPAQDNAVAEKIYALSFWD
ncbi:MAG: family 78 glycoside hydrolase catalytic domain [Clostridiales bacterium]|nr:family 78 glycoside hydrolase catalytic domain [Clostridiales bacterium]